jgi:alpha-glucosidase (family GH31 glycosyl hydrolase)
MPLEGIWLDIPYMDSFADFSVDKTAFPTLKNFTETLH